jgi:hypothetical protein
MSKDVVSRSTDQKGFRFLEGWDHGEASPVRLSDFERGRAERPAPDARKVPTFQYDARRDPIGWTVFDRWTGQIVVLSAAEQSGLEWICASELVDRLNHRGLCGDRSLLQHAPPRRRA